MTKLKCRWVDAGNETCEGILISIQPSDCPDHYVGIVVKKGTFKTSQIPLDKLEVLVK